MLSRLAVKIKNLPPFDFDWADTTPQRPRTSLDVDDFLPSEADATALHQRAVHYMTGFLVETLSSLKHLSEFFPEPVDPSYKKIRSSVPMKILYEDEKYKSQTIDILTQLMSDTNLLGQDQVHTNNRIIILVWVNY